MQNELEAIRGQAYGRLAAGLVVVGVGEQFTVGLFELIILV